MIEKREDDETLYMDGYDDCLIGHLMRFGSEEVAVYSYSKVIDKNMSMGMDHDEAVEYFYFNQIGAWMGEFTPAFLSDEDAE